MRGGERGVVEYLGDLAFPSARFLPKAVVSIPRPAQASLLTLYDVPTQSCGPSALKVSLDPGPATPGASQGHGDDLPSVCLLLAPLRIQLPPGKPDPLRTL